MNSYNELEIGGITLENLEDSIESSGNRQNVNNPKDFESKNKI